MKTLKDIDLKGKTVLVRAGFDVPIENGKVQDNFRITAGLETVKYLLQNHCKIILAFHIGRKGDKENPALPVAPVVEELKRIMRDVSFLEVSSWAGQIEDSDSRRMEKKMARGLREGQILVLENLRLHPGEEKNDDHFARELASLADVFVQDAFCVLHRDHASVTGVPKYLLTVAGFLVAREVEELDNAAERPTHPALVVIGGAKTETKIPVIANLLTQGYDQVLAGGVVANIFLKNQKVDLKNSTVDQEYLDDAAAIWDQFQSKIVLPSDYVWNEKEQIFDIGGETIRHYQDLINAAKTIIWNGPMGVFEEEKFRAGTLKIGEAIAVSSAKKIAGGGDTIAALRKFKLLKQMDFISTGGGVMLEFLAGKKLPGLKILNK
ncbi:MAG: phosphoglycerate kinase [Parcubacteria group bacterium LiPW_72]|nr:MAG: phosphoglycerate kinase [Parcubacteria group bacterium LiPW_72]